MSRILLVVLALAAGSPLFAQDPAANVARCLSPDTIIVRGNSRVERQRVVGSSGLTLGAPLNFPAIQRAIRDLFATGDFDDVRVTCGIPDAPTGAAIVIDVKERPLLGDVKVEGPRDIPPRTVEDRIELLFGRPVDPALVATAMRRIDSLYKSRGYYLARIRPETTTTGDDRIALTFHIDEGRRLAVSGLRVTGSPGVGAERIAAAMETKPEGFWFFRKGEFDEDVYATDLGERLPKLFAERGYVDFQLVRDTLIVDPERGKALIDLTVNEGEQYRVRAFEVVGNRHFTTEQIATLYPFKDRAPTVTERARALLRRRPPATNIFDRTRWEEATQQLQTMYGNDGYIYAQIAPVVEREPGDSSYVRLRWDIREREPAIINRVEIVGNDFTVENCIRDQLFIIPGDVFNQDRLIRSWQSIGNLGFFETPLPFPDTRPVNDQGDIDIIFRVKEKRTGNVNFGASAGQGTGIGGFIGLDQPNLFGRCKRGSVQWQYGRYINDFNMSYLDPGIRGSRISGQVTGYHSQSRFRIANFGQTTRIGGNVRVGFPWPGSRFTRIFTSYGLESVRFGSSGLLGEVAEDGCQGCLRSTVGLDVARDTRVDMPFATEGKLQQFSAQFNGGPLGGSAHFQRYTAEVRNYALLARLGGARPGSQPLRLTMGLTTRFGAVFGNPGDFFWSQQFSLGGVQFGEPLRGYPEFSITPRGFNSSSGTFNAQRESFGSAFMTTTAEVGIRFNQSLYISAFYDAGNIWDRPRDFDPTRLFRGAGIGASTISPLGPLGLDFAYGFDRRDALGQPDPQWQLHFRLGQLF
jgi:outer membrane protein insertion porin family